MPKKKPNKPATKVDEAIMSELLTQPGIKEQVSQMTPEMLEWFKDLLVKQGIYARYVKERGRGGR